MYAISRSLLNPGIAILPLVLAVSAACGGPPDDRALDSHRGDLAPWVTEAIHEDGQTLRVGVSTHEPADALGIAAHIVSQRRSQGWQTIHVEVRPRGDSEGAPVMVTTRYPFATDDVQVVMP